MDLSEVMKPVDFNKLITRFRQFGGLRLVWQYTKLGATSGFERSCEMRDNDAVI